MDRRKTGRGNKGWYIYDGEYNRRKNGFEAVILPKTNGYRRLLIFSIYDATNNLIDKSFTTIKSAKEYAENALTDDPAINLKKN